ncbi:unnamed protein product [Acanthoscelides obtectus]|uniref:DUF4817 domain-containing protein n=1 Tax=Acanthoscelides obtectus TaxID=200917 RepID=A0A9P0PP55_ACAOB|nr:unnamed protein product [Acanthoscelides obtectus]CAK1660411.1 hypothetical protein AOBTE_LOCUS22046 [Acanthoscelides obtectus]
MVNSRPLEAIFIYGATRNFLETKRIFNDRFPNRTICRKYLRELVSKFTATGSVNNKKPPRSSDHPGRKASSLYINHDKRGWTKLRTQMYLDHIDRPLGIVTHYSCSTSSMV